MNSYTFEPVQSKRGKTRRNKFCDERRKAIIEHVESFGPEISHYRRLHAHNRRYLPIELNINVMWRDFLKKYSIFESTSYETYRLIFKSMNITICKLRHEECETCEKVDQHHTDHSKSKLYPNCIDCNSYSRHKQRANEARSLYEKHATLINTMEDTVFYAVDLEKVIMLPRMETFKQVLFTQRISAYNKSFAPIGSFKNVKIPMLATIWHEGISGRKQEQIINAYHQFFLQYRDYKHVVLWLDNCFSQNKNWALLSYLI